MANHIETTEVGWDNQGDRKAARPPSPVAIAWKRRFGNCRNRAALTPSFELPEQRATELAVPLRGEFGSHLHFAANIPDTVTPSRLDIV
ncbi:MAG TPA: hypothetical protein VIV60_15315 [Polyangiaceae bacterium]